MRKEPRMCVALKLCIIGTVSELYQPKNVIQINLIAFMWELKLYINSPIYES